MTDFYFSKYYQDIKDIQWPDCNNLSQFFLNSPSCIIDECYKQHDLMSFVNERESIAHYRRSDKNLSLGYKKNSLVFVPVLKCASTFFSKLFMNTFSRWETVNLYEQDWDQITAVGIMIDPYTRRLNGIIRVLTDIYTISELETLLESDIKFGQLLAMIPWLDSHSMPYTLMYGNLLEKINWIPMEIGKEHWIKKLNKFLPDDPIPLDCVPANQATEQIQNLRHKLSKIMISPPHNEFQGALAFVDDLKFYLRLIKQFQRC